jgi:antitoxin component YwqK of YwqJK toxin-antitoxin module
MKKILYICLNRYTCILMFKVFTWILLVFLSPVLSAQNTHCNDLNKINGRFYLYDSLFSGICIKSSNKGVILESVEFLQGEYQGSYLLYYRNGQLKMQGRYIAHIPNGIWIWYYRNGTLKTEGAYMNGRQDEKWTWWKKNQQIKEIKFYNEGIEIPEPQ